MEDQKQVEKCQDNSCKEDLLQGLLAILAEEEEKTRKEQ